jgi:hypothetical protein
MSRGPGDAGGQGDQCQAHPPATLVLSRCVAFREMHHQPLVRHKRVKRRTSSLYPLKYPRSFLLRGTYQDKQAMPPVVSSTSSRQHCSSYAVGTGSVVLQRGTCPCCLPSNSVSLAANTHSAREFIRRWGLQPATTPQSEHAKTAPRQALFPTLFQERLALGLPPFTCLSHWQRLLDRHTICAAGTNLSTSAQNRICCKYP